MALNPKKLVFNLARLFADLVSGGLIGRGRKTRAGAEAGKQVIDMVEKATNEAKVYCQQCGKSWPASANYCGNCGCPL